MKLLLFNDYNLGILAGDTVRDVSNVMAQFNYHTPQEMMQMLITNWETLQPQLAEASQAAAAVPLSDVQLCPPMPRPGQLVCLAGNYIEPQAPERTEFNAFLKSPNSVIAHGGTVELAPAEASVFHFEPEFALIIGKRASRVSAAEAMDHVFGYTQFMDVSARGLPGGFFLGKSWHTFGPMGPLLLTKDEIAEPNNLPIKLWVNDELRHDFTTNNMDRHLPELLEEVTNVLTLEAGDVVSTGTHHYGLEPVQDGDTIKLEIESMGAALVVTCVDPKGRKWV